MDRRGDAQRGGDSGDLLRARATSPSPTRRRSTFHVDEIERATDGAHAPAPELVRLTPPSPQPHAAPPKVTQLTAAQYDALERAIAHGARDLGVAARHRVRRHPVDSCASTGGREAIEAHHPTTGDQFTLYIDEIDGIEVVR